METIVCKFGGTSLADAAMIRKCAGIVLSDPRRRFIVPSAPGKRRRDDKKITDLLLLCHQLAAEGLHFGEPLSIIRSRYMEIAAELGIVGKLESELDKLETALKQKASRDLIASRGEYLNGILIADLLGAKLVNPAGAIFFNKEGRLDETRTYKTLGEKLKGSGLFVVPGFFGCDHDGQVKTFPRGGSDITGAVVAAAVRASVYENWTDVSGLLMADPNIVKNPKPMPVVTYVELRELSYMGANVLHDEALFPVRKLGIPVNIKNTHDPDHPGTMIVGARPNEGPRIVGVAGKKGFTVITLSKAMMNKERGFGRRVLEIIETHGISFEHTPTGIDTMSLVIANEELNAKLEAVTADIRRIIEPDTLEANAGMALLAVVGQGMVHHVGIAAKIFGALAEVGVNIRMIDQGSSELNIIIGVEEADFARAVNAIYFAVFE